MSRFQREELVKQLKAKGISDDRVLEAIGTIHREKFIPSIMHINAYKDIALPIGYEQTISQPYTVAIMTEKLNVKKGDKVLEIGTGSGYQAAILDFLGAKVFSIEINLQLYHQTTKLFDKLGLRVHAKYGDGTIGWAEFAPFDGIIVTAGSPVVPNKLKEQLKVGGRIVIPVGKREYQDLQIVSKISEEEFSTEVIPRFAFVPLLGREGWKE